jgi:DNA helicase-2/ATP-dependent DNA helicase PcrA
VSIDFEKLLNPEQVQAVTHRGGPQLVLAGAGTGKTRVITYRVAWLIQECKIDPWTIAAVTFTNKAAAEMKERIEDLLDTRPLASFVGTFHRCALRLLRIHGERIGLDKSFAIFDSSDQLSLVKKALKAEKLDDKSFRPRSVLAAISGAKNRLLTPSQFEREADDFFSRKVAPVYRRYQRLLRESSAVDFDDMIGMAVSLLENHQDVRATVRRRSRFLLVDEFQDTNHAQLRLIHQLAGGDGQLTAVGDEDQGIYRWRGAELENILEFERTFPGARVYKLERNYRSTQNILDAAGAMVANNEGRRGKSLWTEAGAGDKVVLYRGHDERDEARWVTNLLRGYEGKYRLGDMAVLVRTNAQTRSFEEELLRQGLPYLLVGAVRFYERAEIKDLVAYLRFLRNPRDAASLGRILNQPPRGIGKTTRDQLQELADQAGRSLWETLEDGDLSAIAARGAKALERFRDTMAPLIAEARELPLPTLLERLIEATSYTSLYDEHDEDERGKLENVGELVSAVQEFATSQSLTAAEEDPLTAFLDHVSLVADVDALGSRGGVPLMTLHSAKGLEFKVVVVAGLEEKLLPHFNAFQPEAVEEERRLLYVGMTRARRQLFLTTCSRRMVAGSYQDQEESRFLSEIPEQYLTVEESPQLFRSASPGRSTSWGSSTSWDRSPSRGPSRQSPAAAKSPADNVFSFFGRGAPASGSQRVVEVDEEASPAVERRGSSQGSGSGQGGGLSKGTWVRHATLGRGRILSIEGSGEDKRLIVYFQGQGRRKLVAKYAKLEIC